MRGAAGLLLAGLLAACAQSMPEAEPAVAPSSAEQRLLEAALRAERALAGLERVRRAELARGAPEAVAAPVPRLVPAVLLRRVNLDWTGPLEALVARLAAEAGYGFEVAGARPVRPVVVSVRGEDRPLIALLRDAGLQAGAVARVVVDPDRRGVRLDWASPVRR